MLLDFIKILFKEGFIVGVEKRWSFKGTLKYDLFLTPAIQMLKLFQTPNKTFFYVNYKNLSKIIKLDSLILLTPEGILV